VSRLCTSSPDPVELTTCVTPPSRAKNGELATRSRSARYGLDARSAGDVPTVPDLRAVRGSRGSLSMPKR
jgi:hypothetical protein